MFFNSGLTSQLGNYSSIVLERVETDRVRYTQLLIIEGAMHLGSVFSAFTLIPTEIGVESIISSIYVQQPDQTKYLIVHDGSSCYRVFTKTVHTFDF